MVSLLDLWQAKYRKANHEIKLGGGGGLATQMASKVLFQAALELVHWVFTASVGSERGERFSLRHDLTFGKARAPNGSN